MVEPVLSPEDVRVWDRWRITFAMHARSLAHRRAVDMAKRIAGRALDSAKTPLLAWSGGKDSTALVHLVRVELGANVHTISEKDDLDYPSEETYVRDLASRFAIDLEILRPETSPLAWLLERRGALSAGEDMHSRSAGLSKTCFYGVMERANEGRDLLLWGLRAEESGRRERLLTAKGVTYQLKSGQVRCAPLAGWTGLDVFAYLQAHDVDPLHVYRCCGWLPEHRQKPWLIRKSWWIPGAHAAKGAAAWLKRYYPSLFAVLRGLAPDAACYA